MTSPTTRDTYESLVSATLDFVYLFDLEGRFRFVNKPLLDLWGLSVEQAIGKNFFDLRYPSALAERLQQQIRTVIESRQSVRDETPYTSPTGVTGHYEYIFTPVLAADGRVEAVAGTTRDVTQRKRAEEDLRASDERYRSLWERLREGALERERLLEAERSAREEAERVSRIKDEFLATLSHELRTPLNAILGWSQIMRQRAADPQEVARALTIIERNARSQAQIIEDLLDMSRIIAGKIRLDVQPLDLPALVRSAIDTAKPAAEAKGIELLSKLDPLLGVDVTGDAHRLHQVLWNLLSNAVKFTPQGGRVEVVLAHVDAQLELSVGDSGDGIAQDFLAFVFDRFRQADATTTRRHGGLGLGLAIVKQLVELHGGTVRVESQGAGQGARFLVRLPRLTAQAEPEPEQEPLRQSLPPGVIGPSHQAAELRGVRVLVVDDEPDARALLQRVLEDNDASVVAAESVASALHHLGEQRFDLIISDIGMPGEDGYSLIRKVRALPRAEGGATPAVALTAYARAEDRKKALQDGYQVHLVKPIEPSELVTVAARLTGRT